MKVHLSTKQLASALSSLERIVPSRSSNPGLTYILVSLDQDRLTLGGTNMEMDLEMQLTADAAGNGSWAVPGHVLSQVVRALPADTVDLEFGEGEVRIRSGSFDTKLQLVDPDQAPTLQFPSGFDGELPAEELSRVLTSVRYAAAANDYQAVFRGIRLELHEGHLRAVGSDGFRLAYCHASVSSGLDADIILPARAVDELGRLLDSGTVRLHLEAGQLSLAGDDFRLNVKLMDGNFPDYNRVLPRNFLVDIKVPAQELLNAVNRVALLADASANNRVDLFIDGGTLTLISEGAFGGAQEALTVEQGGNESQLALSYNARYLVDAVKPVSGPVSISFSGVQTPSVVRGDDEQGYLAMIVPLKTVVD